MVNEDYSYLKYERERGSVEREREKLYFKVFEFYLEYSTELKFHAFQKQHFEEMQ